MLCTDGRAVAPGDGGRFARAWRHTGSRGRSQGWGRGRGRGPPRLARVAACTVLLLGRQLLLPLPLNVCVDRGSLISRRGHGRGVCCCETACASILWEDGIARSLRVRGRTGCDGVCAHLVAQLDELPHHLLLGDATILALLHQVEQQRFGLHGAPAGACLLGSSALNRRQAGDVTGRNPKHGCAERIYCLSTGNLIGTGYHTVVNCVSTFRCPEAELGPLQGAGVRCAVLTCGQLVCTSVFTAGGTHRPACPWSLRTTTELVATTYIYPIERPSVKTRALCFQTASRSAHALLWDFHHK